MPYRETTHKPFKNTDLKYQTNYIESNGVDTNICKTKQISKKDSMPVTSSTIKMISSNNTSSSNKSKNSNNLEEVKTTLQDQTQIIKKQEYDNKCYVNLEDLMILEENLAEIYHVKLLVNSRD